MPEKPTLTFVFDDQLLEEHFFCAFFCDGGAEKLAEEIMEGDYTVPGGVEFVLDGDQVHVRWKGRHVIKVLDDEPEPVH